MKGMRKMSAILLAVILCVGIINVSVFAATTSQDGLEVTLTTDKKEYSQGEKIIATLTVKNTNDFAVKNVSLKRIIPEGYGFAEGTEAIEKIETLGAGKSLEVPVTYVDEEKVGVSDNNINTDTNDKNNSTNSSFVDTGDGNNIMLWSLLLIIAYGGTIAVLVTRKKNSRSILAVVLCVTLVGTSLSWPSIGVNAEEPVVNTIEVEEIIRVNGKDVTLKAEVNYQLSVDDGKAMHTVTFETNGGSVIDIQTVEKGQLVVKPEDPVKDNYVFDKWCVDSELATAFDFTTVITDDITLYARWITEDDNLTDDIIDLGDIETMVSDGKIEVTYDEQGEIITIEGAFIDKKVNTPEEAVELLANCSELFSDDFNVGVEDIVKQTVDDGSEDEENYFRYVPTVDGIMVLGSQIIISADENGHVTGLFSSYDDTIESVNTNAEINEEEAVAIAINAVMSRAEVVDFLESLPGYEDNAETIENAFRDELSVDNSLMIYAADENVNPALVYAVTVRRYDCLENDVDIDEDADETINATPVLDVTYYICANDSGCGTIYKVIVNSEGWSTVQLEGRDLLGDTRVVTGQEQEGTYRLKDTTRNLTTYKTAKTGALWWTEYVLPGNIAKSNSFLGNEWLHKAGVSAHANMSETYDYYKNVLGRKSFDGNGAAVKVSYDYGSNYKNAYWTSSGQQFVFGSGEDYVAALDIVAHEYTHAVIGYVVGNGYTTTLTYSGETGALNEAYADILGSLVENKTGVNFWQIGEDAGDVMRSMANPTAYGQPEHYSALSDPDWSRQLDNYVNRDNEGVHIFGGVYCHAVYKMMTDSRCSSISKQTWSKVFYRSLFRLTTSADFLDGRGAVLSAAKNLGYTASQQQAIKDAFDSVGIKEPDGVRIVLTWGETPRDLDSHLVGPGVNNSRFHVYYGDRNYYQDGTYDSSDSLYAVDLDYDDITSYGPEITTIHTLTPGTYYFYVHDYSNGNSSTSTAMANSGATVKVYRGSGNELLASYTVKSSSVGTYWNVCELTISDDGMIEVNEINTYNSSATLQ